MVKTRWILPANAGHVAGLLIAHGERYVFKLPSLEDMVSPSAPSQRPFQHLPSCVCKTHMCVQHCFLFLVHIAVLCREKVLLTTDPPESLIGTWPLMSDSCLVSCPGVSVGLARDWVQQLGTWRKGRVHGAMTDSQIDRVGCSDWGPIVTVGFLLQCSCLCCQRPCSQSQG